GAVPCDWDGGVEVNMTKRPPEMVELRPCGIDYDYLPREAAEAAIRSLRVKLFRQRARWHHERDRATRTVAEFCESDALFRQAHLEARAANRFMRIADAIERGER